MDSGEVFEVRELMGGSHHFGRSKIDRQLTGDRKEVSQSQAC
jgi:hypothetical protein